MKEALEQAGMVFECPNAAVATGLVPWASLACSTRFLVVAANALIWAPAAVALTI